jgi:Domain of unknown function (DUF4160)
MKDFLASTMEAAHRKENSICFTASTRRSRIVFLRLSPRRRMGNAALEIIERARMVPGLRPPRELRRLRALIEENQEKLLEAWHGHIGAKR